MEDSRCCARALATAMAPLPCNGQSTEPVSPSRPSRLSRPCLGSPRAPSYDHRRPQPPHLAAAAELLLCPCCPRRPCRPCPGSPPAASQAAPHLLRPHSSAAAAAAAVLCPSHPLQSDIRLAPTAAPTQPSARNPGCCRGPAAPSSRQLLGPLLARLLQDRPRRRNPLGRLRPDETFAMISPQIPEVRGAHCTTI